jgi:hypothetical protein
MGILGVVRPADKAGLDRAGDAALIADLGSAVLQRLSGRRA